MLLRFAVENVLSFRDQAVLSLLASENAPHDGAQAIRLPGLPPVLKCAAILGANASGKSSLVKAFELARRLVVDGTKAGELLPLRPFKLDEASLAAPSRFEIDLHAGGRRYAYGLAATAEAVESEWLFAIDGDARLPLFERTRSAERPAITLGPALGADEARRQLLLLVAEGTRPNQLFLAECAERNVGELGAVIRWFREGVALVPPSLGLGQETAAVDRRIEESEAFREVLGDLLKGAGTGVSRVTLKSQVAAERPDRRATASGSLTFVEMVLQARRRALGVSTTQLHHASPGGSLVSFVPDEESDGTRRLMGLAPLLFDLQTSAEGTPSVHLLDDLDRGLDPQLARYFVEAFLRTSSAEHPGQLLFTTHDASLLDLPLLPRGSRWVTEKDGEGASRLRSMAAPG